MTILEGLNTVYAQLEADIKVALPDIATVVFGDPQEDHKAPYAAVRLRVENMQHHNVAGTLYEFDAVYSITIVKKVTTTSGVVMTQKIVDAKELTARLTATKKYAGVGKRTTVENIDFDELGDPQVKQCEFTLDVRFFMMGDADG